MRKPVSLILIIIAVNIYSQAGREWVRTLNSSDAYASGNDIAVDASGNVFVTGGVTSPGTGMDFVTIKYSPTGQQLWLKSYNSAGNGSDIGLYIKIDNVGNVIAAGTSEGSNQDPDIVVIKYNSSGTQQWLQIYDGGAPGSSGDNIKGLDIDVNNNVFVTGTSAGIVTSNDIVTIKYSPSGARQWLRVYNSTDDQASGIKVDNPGNVYVSGCTHMLGSMGFALLKYSPNGVIEWVRNYNSPGLNDDRITALTVDNHGNIIISGFGITGLTGYDYVTIKYNAEGIQQWQKIYNGQANSTENPAAIAIDAFDNIYVTGSSTGIGNQTDAATVKYSPEGKEIWVRRFDGPAHSNDRATDIVLDESGNIYLAAESNFNIGFNEIVVLKYDQYGNLKWNRSYGGSALMNDEARSITSDINGNIYVSGKTINGAEISGLSTIKYTQSAYHDVAADSYVDFPVQFITNNTYHISASIYNNGSSLEENVPVSFFINGNQVNAVNLNIYSGDRETISNNWAPESAGIYELKYVSSLVGDSARFNDTIIRTVQVISQPTQTSVINICRNEIGWIPNNPNIALYDTIYVALPNSIGVVDVNLYLDSIVHPRISDLEISLQHLGISDTLISRRGGIGDNFVHTQLNDSANLNISQGTAPFTGTFKPEKPLSAFNGINLNGPWVLKITDLVPGQTGYLKSWCLEVQYQLIMGTSTSEKIPEKFELFQNYPNPFNPTTSIRFSIPAVEAPVQLIIYDLLGHEVQNLVNKQLEPGTYEVEWNASNYSSGVYFYKLSSGDFVETRKMMLVQ